MEAIDTNMAALLSYSIQGRDCKHINNAIGGELNQFLIKCEEWETYSSEVSRVRNLVTQGTEV